MKVEITHIGGASKIGGSSHLIKYKSTSLLLDCGSQYTDNRPSSRSFERLIDEIDAVVITHAHLDHSGATPLLVKSGYRGPIYATHPTRDLMRILLIDAYKLSLRGKKLFEIKDIETAAKQIKPLFYGEEAYIGDLSFKLYDAGHILGSAMILIDAGGKNILYTGDVSNVKDNHLNGADIHQIKDVDLIIIESTYGDQIFESRRLRERKIVESSLETLKNGGSVLIPAFAVGRIQELMLIFERKWSGLRDSYPVFYCAGLAKKALEIYGHYTAWMNKKIQNFVTTTRRNPFEFENIKLIHEPAQIDFSTPSIFLAASGMLNGGFSSYIALRLAQDKKNKIIFPGFCAEGTPARMVLDGKRKVKIFDFIEGDKREVEIRCKVEQINLSAHADQKGLISILRKIKPKITCLVHGEKEAKKELRDKIRKFTTVRLAEDGELHEYLVDEIRDQKAFLTHQLWKKLRFRELDGLKFSLIQGAVIQEDECLRILTLEEFDRLLNKKTKSKRTS